MRGNGAQEMGDGAWGNCAQGVVVHGGDGAQGMMHGG